MMTRPTPFGFESSPASSASFPAHKRFQLSHLEGGQCDVLVEGLASAFATTTKAIVYRLSEAAPPVEVVANTSDFDALLAEMEAAPATAPHLAEGRRWVGRTFYGQAPTLTSLRLAAGLSQAQLGKLCALEQPHVSRYESARHVPTLPMAHTLAKHLGVSLDEFFEAWENTQLAAKEAATGTGLANERG